VIDDVVFVLVRVAHVLVLFSILSPCSCWSLRSFFVCSGAVHEDEG
jgi:hypothetical protein